MLPSPTVARAGPITQEVRAVSHPLLCATSSNSVPQHSPSFPLCCAQHLPSPLIAHYWNCFICFTCCKLLWSGDFIIHIQHSTQQRACTGWPLASWTVSSVGRLRGWGWGRGLLDFLWTAGKNKGVHSSQDCEEGKKKKKNHGKGRHGSGSHTLAGIRNSRGTC